MRIPISDEERDLILEQTRTFKLLNGYLSIGMIALIAYAIYRLVGVFA